MRTVIATALLAFHLTVSSSFAQPGPSPGDGRRGPPGGGAVDANERLITRMLAFDANADGQLVLDEVTDARLHRLFRRADADRDGTVTKTELTAVAAAIAAEFPNAGLRRGPGGPGGRPRGPGGPPPGGPGRPGNRPPPPKRDQ